MMVSASDWLLMLKSSVMAQLTLFSVVNIPLTSLYAHRAITRDCCREGKASLFFDFNATMKHCFSFYRTVS